MKKILIVVLCIVLIIAGYYGWKYYQATRLISGLDMEVSDTYKSDLQKYNLAVSNGEDISLCESINSVAIFNNGENIKTRCEDSVYFNIAHKSRDTSLCYKMSSDSPMKNNCIEFSSEK